MLKKISRKKKYIWFLVSVLAMVPMRVFAADPTHFDLAASLYASIRTLFFAIDKGVYNLFASVFTLFFQIAETQFLTGGVYRAIFNRIFVILGVFMLFRLSISFISYIISPDSVDDPKNPGNLSKLIGRIVVSILFLVILVPIGTDSQYANSTEGYSSMGAQGTYTYNIQTQGLFFGTLQTVQNAILNNNVLGKLILGNAAEAGKTADFGKETAMTVFTALKNRSRSYWSK